MRIQILLALCSASVALSACAPKNSPPESDAGKKAAMTAQPAVAVTPAVPAPAPTTPADAGMPEDTQATAFGKGTFERADGKLASFTFDANYTRSGPVTGNISYTVFLDEGKIDLSAKVICGHYDMDTKRAWVGGEITENRSNHSAYQDGDYATGGNLWFRFEESETHPDPAAKIADMSFGSKDGATAFCDAKGWSADGLVDLSDQGAVIIFALPDVTG